MRGAAQGGAVGLLSEQLERLLGGTQGRGVGRGAAQDARHAGHGDAESVAQPYGGSGAERDDRDGGEQQPHAVGAHRAEETGPHLQPEGIDEQHETETLDIGQHRGVDRQSAVSGQNPHEEDERRSERNAEKRIVPSPMPTSEMSEMTITACRGRMCHEYVREPLHANRDIEAPKIG